MMFLTPEAYRQLGRNVAEAMNRRDDYWLEFHCQSYRRSLLLEDSRNQILAEKAYKEGYDAHRVLPVQRGGRE